MIDTSSKSALWLAPTGVIIAAVCTTVMNIKFGVSLGSDELEKTIYGLFGIALDICKVFGLAFVANAFAKGYYAKGLAASLVWLTAVCYSLVAATGFAAMTRSNTTAERTHSVEQQAQSIENHKRSIDKYRRLESELNVMKQNHRYYSSDGCTTAEKKMNFDTHRFCTIYQDKVLELKEAQKSIDTYSTQLPTVFVADVDPQMTFFGKLTGLSKDLLVTYWSFGLAIVAEIVSSFGTYGFSSSRSKTTYVPISQRPTVEHARPEVQPKRKKRKGRPAGSKNKPKLRLVG